MKKRRINVNGLMTKQLAQHISNSERVDIAEVAGSLIDRAIRAGFTLANILTILECAEDEVRDRIAELSWSDTKVLTNSNGTVPHIGDDT
jgi:hypothetical protein